MVAAPLSSRCHKLERVSLCDVAMRAQMDERRFVHDAVKDTIAQTLEHA